MVGGNCPQGSWAGNTWITGPINLDCWVVFNFILLDTDGDGTQDLQDADDDNNDLPDFIEAYLGTDSLTELSLSR